MADVEKLITDNIDIWSSAVKAKSAVGRGSSKKLELYGIKKLRELILELAVRGLLMPQDPNDEPVSVLLKNITAEKAKFLKESKMNKQKTLSPISTDEELFKVPESWSWLRLGEIGKIFNGNSVNASEKEKKYTNINGIPFIATKDVGYGFERLDYSNGVAIPDGEEKFKIAKKGSVLICAEGGSAGKKCGIAEEDICFGNKLFANILYGAIEPKYILSLYLSPSFFERFSESMTGIIGGISRAKFMTLPAPIPPLNEQHCIVAKVDELMALCDQLEQQTETSINAHQTLVQALLGTLTSASEREGFNQAWARIAEHFDNLFTTEWSIDQLKQTILKLAVMGKLVPQNPNDEPASELLKKIALEKAQLRKNGKIKKQKQYISFEGLDELKTKRPNTWCWLRLADTADIVRGGSPRPAGDPRFYDGKIPFLKVGDITRKSGKYVEGFNATIKEAGLHKTRLIETRTVLLSNSGATLGIPAICDFPATFNDGIAAFIEKSEYMYDEYLFLYLSTLSKWFLDIASRGQGQPNLNTDIIKSTWLALPSLKEQHRIVTKVDELMALCDILKTQINTAKINQLYLADTMAEQAIN